MRIPSSPLPFLHAIESSTMIARLPHPQDLFSLLPVRGRKLVKILKPDRWSSRGPLSSLRTRPRTSENQFKMYSARVLSILSIYTCPTTHQTSNKIHTCAWRSPTLYLSSDLSFQFQMNKNGRVICEFETMKFMESFVCWRANLTNDNISSAYARSENGYGF